MTIKRKRVVVASRYPMVRGILARYLDLPQETSVVGRAETLSEAAAVCAQVRPDVLVMDGLCPKPPSDAVLDRLNENLPGSIVLLTMSCVLSEELVYLIDRIPRIWCQTSLCEPPDALVDAIRAAAAGRSRGPHPAGDTMCPVERVAHDASLSPNERLVLKLVAEGRPSKSIATRLGLSVRTVENHRFRVMRKLEVGSSVELVRYAVRAGLITP